MLWLCKSKVITTIHNNVMMFYKEKFCVRLFMTHFLIFISSVSTVFIINTHGADLNSIIMPHILVISPMVGATRMLPP